MGKDIYPTTADFLETHTTKDIIKRENLEVSSFTNLEFCLNLKINIAILNILSI